VGGGASLKRRQRTQADRGGADVAGEIGLGEHEGARIERLNTVVNKAWLS
jgi:hypothetical protein